MAEPEHDVGAWDADVEAILAEHSLRLSIISEVKDRCMQGQPLDAKSLLDECPGLGVRKSIVLDLAYEEFCQRVESGESIDLDGYCRRFPTYEKSLRRLLEVHEFLDENRSLLPAVDVDWPEPGHTFEGFSILAELGRGAFARVFLAKEIALGDRLVAVKLSTHGAAEADILGKLRHPNIVPVYSVRQDPQTGLTVVCMPYSGRATLFDVLGKLFAQKRRPTRARSILEAIGAAVGQSSSTESAGGATDIRLRHGSYIDGAVHLGYQLADALAYSHSRGICHSDLKPSNVLITPAGKPMLLDFNLAFDSQAVERRQGGTLPYMAPEQLRAIGSPPGQERPAVGERSDLFSLGVILYELFSGALPFGPIATNRSCEEIRDRLLERQELGPLPLREGNPEVDPPLARLVESCLAQDPEARPRSAAHVAAALRRSVSPGRRARRWTRQHRWVVGLLAGSFLLISLGVGFHLSTRDPYAVRQLKAGLDYYREDEYAKAEEYLSSAAESAEVRAEALFWRARSHQKAGHNVLALRDYEEAAKLCPAPEIRACQAYCWALEGHLSASIRFSNESLDAGFRTPEVYNNLGYSYLRMGDFKSAVLALNEAVSQDDSLQPALYNRALAELRWAAKTRRPVDVQAGADIDHAIDVGPPSAALYLDAARVYSELGRESGEHRERVVRYLREALQLGQNPNIVRREFKSLLDPPALEALLSHSVPGGEPRKAIGLVDPIADDSVRLVAGSPQFKRPF